MLSPEERLESIAKMADDALGELRNRHKTGSASSSEGAEVATDVPGVVRFPRSEASLQVKRVSR